MKKLGFGAMRLPIKNEEDASSVDSEITGKMIDLFMEKGFNYFDTAYPYHLGSSEKVLKEKLVDKYSRGDFLLADKMPLFYLEKEEDLDRFFKEQLERCGVDYFDYYLLHNVSEWTRNAFTDIKSFEFVEKMKKEGKVKHIGISFHDDADLLERVLKVYPSIEVVQLQINYLDWENETIQSKECYEVARKYNKDIIVMEPLKGGTLAKIPEKAEKLFKSYNPQMSVASWANRYAASLEGVFVVLSGMNKLSDMEDNVSYMEDFKPLNKEEYEIIKKVIDIINESITVPCTNCDYCIETCPQGIPISKYFELYNIWNRNPVEGFSPEHAYYRMYALKNTKGSLCDECGECEKQCPQHIQIRKHLKDLVELFEDENF
ncbi:aldo/keto reductase [Methanobrevibacter sp. OttesenSCG-928-I08]|nr:aldo/keto reductase [Methanobrevibacter sp. OttesenSCG-928-I08]